ncbi:MAG: acyltransferase [Lachnospiraceae bacterium]|nr:acyltransferase [Lachnospiraceae bacterium]
MADNTVTHNEVQTAPKHEYYIDVARVFSMISVILIHIGAVVWYDGPFSVYPWGVINLFDILARYCVPVFLMISGYLFLDPGRNIPVKKIYTRYLPRLLTAFFFWSFLYALITSGFATQRTLSGGVGLKLLQDTFWGHYHMWYMYIIIPMYVITPALRAVAVDRKALKYFLIVSYVISYLIPSIEMIPVIYEHTAKYTHRLEFQFITGYIFYYLAGYYFGSEEFTDRARRIVYCLGVAGFVFAVASTTIYVLTMQFPNSELHEYYTAGVPLYSLAAFLFFRDRFATVDPSSRVMKIVLWLSGLSFGVYMAHDFGIIIFNKIGITASICSPFISMPLLTLLDLIITVAIVWTVSRIPVLKKWVI